LKQAARRWLWFAGLWFAGVAVLALVSAVLRMWLK
jgi:hypothetical protein